MPTQIRLIQTTKTHYCANLHEKNPIISFQIRQLLEHRYKRASQSLPILSDRSEYVLDSRKWVNDRYSKHIVSRHYNNLVCHHQPLTRETDTINPDYWTCTAVLIACHRFQLIPSARAVGKLTDCNPRQFERLWIARGQSGSIAAVRQSEGQV